VKFQRVGSGEYILTPAIAPLAPKEESRIFWEKNHCVKSCQNATDKNQKILHTKQSSTLLPKKKSTKQHSAKTYAKIRT